MDYSEERSGPEERSDEGALSFKEILRGACPERRMELERGRDSSLRSE
jgi:hypothetical protein